MCALSSAGAAGKTTLMDALAGLKTVGTLRGDIWVDGHPKNQDTFKRVCGYVQQASQPACLALFVLEAVHAPAGVTLHSAAGFC